MQEVEKTSCSRHAIISFDKSRLKISKMEQSGKSRNWKGKSAEVQEGPNGLMFCVVAISAEAGFFLSSKELSSLFKTKAYSISVRASCVIYSGIF
jgi:hypothetical protein